MGWSDGSTANPRTDTAVTADVTVTAILAATWSAAVGQEWPVYE